MNCAIQYTKKRLHLECILMYKQLEKVYQKHFF